MAYHLPPLGALRAFEAAARHLSFKKAAEELHVTPAAISHQVKALEEYLGLQLFRRLTRALQLTADAQAMLPKVREGFECLAAAVEHTRHPEGAGSLTVSTPPAFASRWLMPRLQRFASIHPHVELRLSARPEMIDSREAGTASVTGMVDPRDQVSDVSIRLGSGKYPGFRVERIFSASYVPVCSPRLLEGEHPLRSPQDLRHHVLIHGSTVPDEADPPNWQTWIKAAGVTDVDLSRGLYFSNAALALESATDGSGVALALQPLVAADVAAGRLVVPFDIAVPLHHAYYLVTSEAVADRPAVAAFRDWLISEAS